MCLGVCLSWLTGLSGLRSWLYWLPFTCPASSKNSLSKFGILGSNKGQDAFKCLTELQGAFRCVYPKHCHGPKVYQGCIQTVWVLCGKMIFKVIKIVSDYFSVNRPNVSALKRISWSWNWTAFTSNKRKWCWEKPFSIWMSGTLDELFLGNYLNKPTIKIWRFTHELLH